MKETPTETAKRITREHALHQTALANLHAAEESGQRISDQDRRDTTHGKN